VKSKSLDYILGLGTSSEWVKKRRLYWTNKVGLRKECFGKYMLERLEAPIPVCFIVPYENDPCCEECVRKTREYRKCKT